MGSNFTMTSTTQRLLQYLRPYRANFGLAMVCMIVFGATDGGVPLLLKSILEGVFERRDANTLAMLPWIILGFTAVRALFDFLQSYLLSTIGHNIVRDIRRDLHRVFLRLDPGFFVSNAAADMVSRSTSDVVLIRSVLTDSVAAVIRDVVRIVALLGAAIYLDPWLAAVGAIVFPLGIYPVSRFGKRLRRLSRQGQEAVGELSRVMHEAIAGTRVVKIFGAEEHEEQNFSRQNQLLTNAFVRSDFYKALTGPVNEVLASAAIAGIILYGGFSVIGGGRTAGEFVSFLAALFLMYDPFKKLSRLAGTVQQGLSGGDRIVSALDLQPQIKDPKAPKPLPATTQLEIEGVTVLYEQGKQAALRKVSLVIPQGKKVALVGLSGSGKSTLVDLIPRFIDPTEGVVRLGGVDLRELRIEDLRASIALVGQHTFLFNETIAVNIGYGKRGASRQEIEAAAQAASAHEFIERLPKGYDTVVGEGGFSLSGGERQRIAIARAILKNAPILILDEATASLDNASERSVQRALDEMSKGRTTIVVAHRLSTIKDADLVVVLHQGEIVEMGTHDELLSRNGEFKRLHALQFSSGPTS